MSQKSISPTPPSADVSNESRGGLLFSPISIVLLLCPVVVNKAAIQYLDVSSGLIVQRYKSVISFTYVAALCPLCLMSTNAAIHRSTSSTVSYLICVLQRRPA